MKAQLINMNITGFDPKIKVQDQIITQPPSHSFGNKTNLLEKFAFGSALTSFLLLFVLICCCGYRRKVLQRLVRAFSPRERNNLHEEIPRENENEPETEGPGIERQSQYRC